MVEDEGADARLGLHHHAFRKLDGNLFRLRVENACCLILLSFIKWSYPSAESPGLIS
jgi:hypothetical protein